MIRKGRFAIWQDREFELESSRRQYYLRSTEVDDEQLGFEKSQTDEHLYLKPVATKELDDAYEIIPYVYVSGYRFAVEGFSEETGLLSLVTNNPFVQDKLKVRSYGKFEYIIEVPLKEVEIEEDRIPILGFEESYP